VAARVSRGKYQCQGCKAIVGASDIRIDHCSPVVDPKTGFVDWNTYLDRLFCDGSNLQCLCKDKCHREKTRLEGIERAKKNAA
jgi:hypothetical protein